MIYILLGVIFLLLVVLIIGLFLPKTRVLKKETIYNAPIEIVYNTVTNNKDWKYRKSLDNLNIIETNNDIETWEEVSEGNVILFKTKEKRPFTFYSFEMNSKLFKGSWFAEFEYVENGKTRFTATESIEYKNLFIRVIGYIFMNLDKYMETYQNELREKVEKSNS